MSNRSCRRFIVITLLSAVGVMGVLGAEPAGPVGPPVPSAAQPAAQPKPADPEPPPLISLRRTQYFTRGSIAVRAQGWNAWDPAADELALQLHGEDGSRVRVLFQPIARPLSPQEKIDPDGPTLSAWLLRPGDYTLDAAAGAARSQARLAIQSAVRRSTFPVIDAGFEGSAMTVAPRGEDGLGFNLLFPFADRPGASAAWTAATDPMIVGVPPGEGVAAGLWLPSITDPLRRSRTLADGSAESAAGGWLYPAFASELSSARDRDRPAVCLPSSSPRDANAWQVERNLAFIAGSPAVAAGPLAGSAAAGEPAVSSRLLDTVIASNKLAARLGTIFTTMPPTHPPVAVLVPQAPCDTDDRRAMLVLLAGQSCQQRLAIVTPADVLDGSVSRHHRAVVLATSGLLDGRTTAVLARYVQGGGAVLLPDDAVTDIPGATKLGVPIDISHFQTIDRLAAQDKPQDATRLRRPAQILRLAEPLARALRAKLDALGVRPAMWVDTPTVFTAQHRYGEVEYHFAVNATPDDAVGVDPLAVKPVTATLSLPAADGAVYDAISGGPAPFKSEGTRPTATLRLGPGQMRVFARTARPIAGVQVLPPQVVSDYRGSLPPIRLELSAMVVDDAGRGLSGAIPLRVRVIDSLGVVRYDLWRATERGILRLDLPLAANDPAGRWTVAVQEMLGRHSGQARFDYSPPAQLGAIAELTTGFDAGQGQPLRERPAATTITPANKATRPGEAAVVWQAAMPDRVVSIQVEQQKLTVFSHDGSGTQLDGDGAVLSQSAAPVIASPRPPQPLPPAVAKNVLKDRTVKRSATEGGLTAVAYWGGMVQIFSPGGTARAEQVLPSGVADLVWFDGKLIVGLSDGAVMALSIPGP